MRAILIDPEKRTFTEIQVADNSREIDRVLRCRSFTIGAAPLSGSIDEAYDTVYVSDDELQEEDDPRFWFQVDAERNPSSSYPIAGLGLVCGIDPEGEACDVHVGAAALQSRITFTQRKFRGYKTLFGAAARARGLDIAIEVIAPVIDGMKER